MAQNVAVGVVDGQSQIGFDPSLFVKQLVCVCGVITDRTGNDPFAGRAFQIIFDGVSKRPFFEENQRAHAAASLVGAFGDEGGLDAQHIGQVAQEEPSVCASL